MKEIITIEHSYKRVAELLKVIVNGRFEGAGLPYPETEKAGASLFDLMAAIDLLEKQDTKVTHITDE